MGEEQAGLPSANRRLRGVCDARAASFISHDDVWRALEGLLFEIEARLDDVDLMERQLRRSKLLFDVDRLGLDLTRGLLKAYQDWLESVGREWGMSDPRAT